MYTDLSRTVDMAGMQQLGGPALVGMLEGLETPEGTEWVEVELPTILEAAGGRKLRVLVTKPETLADRKGYQKDFLDGWIISLPEPKAEFKNDVRQLRRGGRGFELKYQHFSTVQSVARRMPMFVAVNIDGTQERKITRTSIPWCFDGRLDVNDQIGDEVYAEQKNVLDRGHMVRREDPIWGNMEIARRANIDTFHFTNACPQMAAVNQHIWLGLENYVLRNTRQQDMRVTVFTGPVFTGSDFPYRGALVPKSFWKVVAVVTEDGRPSATAYEVSQEQQLSALEFVFGQYETFQCSIREIEEKTSLSFGDLARYDGYSVSERKTGKRARAKLESLEMVRI